MTARAWHKIRALFLWICSISPLVLSGQATPSGLSEDSVLVLLQTGREARAALVLNSLKEHYQREDDLKSWLELYKSVGLFYRKTAGKPLEAKAYYAFGIDSVFRQPSNDEEWKAMGILNNHLGFTQQHFFGTYLQARESFQAALDIFQGKLKGNAPAHLQYVLHELGNINTRLGDYEKAINYLSRKKEMLEKQGDAGEEMAWLQGDLSRAYFDLGRLDLSERVLREALVISGLSPGTKAFIRMNLSETLLAEAKLQEALAQAKQAIAYFQRTRSEVPTDTKLLEWLSYAYQTAGKAAFQLGDAANAGRYLDQSIQIIHQAFPNQHRREIGKQYLARGHFFLKTGKPVEALGDFQKALQSVLPDFKPVSYDQDPKPDSFYPENTILEALEGKAAAYRQLSRTKEQVLNLTRELRNWELVQEVERLLRRTYYYESSKLFIGHESKSRTAAALKVCLELQQLTGDSQYAHLAFQMAEESRAAVLRESLHKMRLLDGISDATLVKTINDLEMQRGWLLTSLAQKDLAFSTGDVSVQEALLRQQLFDLDQKLDATKRQLLAKYPDSELIVESSRKTLKELQKSLAPGQIILEYFLEKDASCWFAVGSQDLRFGSLHTDSTFSSYLDRFLQLIRKPLQVRADQLEFESLGHFLGHVLWEGIRGNSYSEVIIIPDGPLYYLPFETLPEVSPTKDSTQYVFCLEKMAISYSWAAGILGALDSPRDGKDQLSAICSFAPKKYPYASLMPLDAPDWEAFFSGLKWNSVNFSDSQASVRRLQENYSGSIILQFFTHAAADSLPWIAFSDRKMYLPEIYATRFKADLVVLSACETGIGHLDAGEGSLSLARGFAFAGVPSMLMSLWKIQSDETADLLQRFYKFLQKGSSKSEALRLAKLEYLGQARTAHRSPYYWAGLTLIGNPDPLPALVPRSLFSWWFLFPLLFLPWILGSIFRKGK